MEPKYLEIRSTDRVDTTTDTSNFVVNLPTGVKLQGVKQIALKHVFLPNIVDNISAALGNNQFVLNDGVSDFVITIPDGNYTAANLESVLEALLDTAFSNSFAVVLNTTTYVMSVAGTAAFTLKFANYPATAKVLGYNATSYGPATLATGTNAWNLSQPYCYYIRVNEFGYSGTSTRSADDAYTFVVPANGNSGDLISY